MTAINNCLCKFNVQKIKFYIFFCITVVSNFWVWQNNLFINHFPLVFFNFCLNVIFINIQISRIWINDYFICRSGFLFGKITGVLPDPNTPSWIVQSDLECNAAIMGSNCEILPKHCTIQCTKVYKTVGRMRGQNRYGPRQRKTWIMLMFSLKKKHLCRL